MLTERRLSCRRKLLRQRTDKPMQFLILVMESSTTVLQRTHLKTDFTNTVIPSSMRIRQTPQNYQSISLKSNQVLVSDWSYQTIYKRVKKVYVMLNREVHILTSPINLINKRSKLVPKWLHENTFYCINPF